MQNPADENLTESDPLQSPVRFTAGSSFPSGKPKSFLDQIAIFNPTNNGSIFARSEATCQSAVIMVGKDEKRGLSYLASRAQAQQPLVMTDLMADRQILLPHNLNYALITLLAVDLFPRMDARHQKPDVFLGGSFSWQNVHDPAFINHCDPISQRQNLIQILRN